MSAVFTSRFLSPFVRCYLCVFCFGLDFRTVRVLCCPSYKLCTLHKI